MIVGHTTHTVWKLDTPHTLFESYTYHTHCLKVGHTTHTVWKFDILYFDKPYTLIVGHTTGTGIWTKHAHWYFDTPHTLSDSWRQHTILIGHTTHTNS